MTVRALRLRLSVVFEDLHGENAEEHQHDSDRSPMLNGNVVGKLEPLGTQSPRRKHPEDQRDVNSDDGADTTIRAEKRLHGACLVCRRGADFTNRTYRSIPVVLRPKRWPVKKLTVQ